MLHPGTGNVVVVRAHARILAHGAVLLGVLTVVETASNSTPLGYNRPLTFSLLILIQSVSYWDVF